MARKTPKGGDGGGQSWEAIMAELNDKSLMEDLRVHIANNRLFPRNVNPETAAIKMDYLQKLARHWKLHHTRGFWRDHAKQSDLVRALYQRHLTLEASSARHKGARAAGGTDNGAGGSGGGGGDADGGTKAGGHSNTFLPYSVGDKFGTRGDYVAGSLYLSRLTTPGALSDDTVRHAGSGGGGGGGGPGGAAGGGAGGAAGGGDAGAGAGGGQCGAGVGMASEDGDDAAATDNAVDASETAKNCTLALCNFSSSEAFRPKIVEAGALATLVAMWHSCEEGMKDEVAVALCRLGADDTKEALMSEGALPAVLSLASTRAAEVQQLCAKTLVLVSSVGDHVVVLLHEGILPALELLASSGDAVTKMLCAQVLNNLSAPKVHRSTMVKEDAVKIVLPLTMETKADTRRYAVWALTHLCCHKRSQQKIVMEGVVAHLMRLVKSEDRETHESAVTAICKLCFNRPSRTRLVDEGIVPIIVEQANADNPKLQKNASLALLNLSNEAGPVRVAIMEAGGVASLLKLSEAGSEGTRKGCAVALCNLLCHADTEDKVIELNALGAFDALASSTDEGIKERTATTLYHLVGSPESGAAVVRGGGLSSLLALTTAESMDTVAMCVEALQVLSASFEHHVDLLAARAVERATELSRMKHDRVKVGCVNLLVNLTCNTAAHSQLKARGVVATIIHLTTFDTVKSQTAAALCNFTANHDMRSYLIEQGAVPVLIALARSTREATKQACARAICNLSCLPGCEQAIVSSGGASGLIMIALFRSDTTETKGICASALLNLMTDAGCRKTLVHEDLVWVLIKLASSEESNNKTRSICARALCSLSYSRTGCAKLVENKATPALFFLCRDGDAATQRYAAITLLNLCADKARHEPLLQQGAVKCLVELADADDVETRLHSLGALSNLSAFAGGRGRMIDENAAAALSLDKCKDQETMRRCAIALVNLSSRFEDQGTLVRQGALQGLLGLCQDGSPLIRELCAHAMFNLSFQPESRHALVAAKALPSLATVSMSDSPYVYRLCATAFCNLAGEAGCSSAVVEAGGAGAIVHLLRASDQPHVRRAGLTALCHLVLERANHGAIVDAGALPVLLERSNDDMDSLRLVACIALHMSAHAAVRAALVSQGVCKFCVAHVPDANPGVHNDCKTALVNLTREESTLVRAVDDGIVGAFIGLAEEPDVGDQRMVASALCHLTKPEPLRERVVELGIMTPLSLLLRSELEDVRKTCSIAIRNLSTCAGTQGRMVDAGALPLLIDTMTLKDDAMRATSPPPHYRAPAHGVPAGIALDAGEPFSATEQVLVPAFTEAQVAGSDAVAEEKPGPAAHESKAEDARRPGGAADLGNAEGLLDAHKLSAVALGEPLWTKVHVEDMQMSSPTLPAPQNADDRSRVRPGTDGGDRGGGGTEETKTEAIMGDFEHGVPSDDSDDDLGFDFKYHSPSAKFYAAQSKTPQSTVLFEPTYTRGSLSPGSRK